MIKTAVIMAAGLGTRFGEYTEKKPKGFIDLAGTPMIIRSIETLLSCGIERIVIGTGYLHDVYDKLKEQYPMIETCYSPRYAETNSMYTLYNTRDVIGDDDFLLLESDLLFDCHAILSLMADSHAAAILVTPVTKFQDQYYVESNVEGVLTRCSVIKEELDDVKGEFVGIHKLSNEFFRAMCNDYAQIVDEKPKLGYEYELLHMSQKVMPVYVHCAKDIHWYEIDDESDLRYAEEHVAPFCELKK